MENEKLKIVMIGPFGLTVKSTMRERALPMARALVERGHEVTMLIPPWDSPQDAGQINQDQGVCIINTTLPKPNPFYHLQLTYKLVKKALQLKPDVIHFFKPKAYAGLAHLWIYILKVLKLHTIKLVVDTDDWERAWNNLGNYTSTQKSLFKWQEPWGLKHADAVTVASRKLRYLTRALKVSTDKIYYVPNGKRSIPSHINILRAFSPWRESLIRVSAGYSDLLLDDDLNLPIFDDQPGYGEFGNRIREKYGLYGNPIVLLYTRFFEFKVSFLVDIIAAVSEELPDVRWLIVGKGYFDEETELKQLAESRKVANKLVFAGWVPMSELPYYFAAANVALYPYDNTVINQTKCSVKLLDLLTSGVPVIATNIGQNSEYIVHGETGVLVPHDNVQAMADNTVLVLTSSHIQQVLGRQAIFYVTRKFSWNTLIKRVEAAYTYSEISL